MTFLDDIREKFGDSVFTSSADVTGIISSGSISLDASTGIGGLPLGRFVNIYGPESSGKTTLALSIAKEGLKLGLKTLYIDVEQTLDNNLTKSILGEYYNEKTFVVARPENAEQAFQVAEAAIQSKEFTTVIFDSLGALSPTKEIEDDFEDANVSLAARLITKFHRRNAYTVRVNKILFIFINQVRDKIGAYIKSYETPGGHALKHYSSLTVMLSKGEDLEIKDGKKKIKYGIWSKFIVKKNKVGPPHREASFPIVWGKGIDYLADVLEFSSMLGVVSTRGPYFVFGDENLGLGKIKAIERLGSDKELLDKVVKECYTVVGVKSIIPDEEVIDGKGK